MTPSVLRLAYDRLARGVRRLVDRPGPSARRSVLFLHNSYYHFYYLAQALRRRGWDALTVSLEDPHGPHANFYHGEDLNLYHPSYAVMQRRLFRFFYEAARRFRLLHFAGDGSMSFFPDYFPHDDPPDIVEWRALGNKVAYTISGCSSATAQSSVARWSALDGQVLCDKCPWQHRPDICCDARNLAWGRKVRKYCDLVCAETLPALDFVTGPNVIREPLTMCLDPEVWRPDLPIPAEHVVPRAPGELLVYHAFGNFHLRGTSGRNIKGSPAISAAVERLQAEGLPVRLVFCTDRKNTEVRYYQLQADVVVDQLNAGRYGANARESMMLARPTICYQNRHEWSPQDRLACLDEVPLVSATEQTVYDELKRLLLNAELRAELGRRGRAYALKWHSAEACAERYEQVYDALLTGARRVAA
jgi:hypothetical protein